MNYLISMILNIFQNNVQEMISNFCWVMFCVQGISSGAFRGDEYNVFLADTYILMLQCQLIDKFVTYVV